MCNRMKEPTNNLVLEVMKQNEGELKHFDRWFQIINDELPKPKRLTRRSMAHMIRFIASTNKITVRKEVIKKNVFYEFDITSDSIP